MIDAASENIVTLTEAGRRLGKTRETVAAYVRAGKLDGATLDGRVHTSLEALARFVRPLDAAKEGAKRKRGTDPENEAMLRRLGVSV